MLETRILIPDGEEKFYMRQADFLKWCLEKYGGYTVYGQTVGTWKDSDGKVYVDTMVCVGVAADTKCYEAVKYAKELFEQKAIYCTFHEAEII